MRRISATTMKKIFLILIIAASGAFIYLKIQTLTDDSSAFNQTTRYELGKRGWVRTILGLHKDGDARLEYLQGTTPLIVEVVQSKSAALPDEALSNFVAKVSEYTGRNVIVYNVDTIDNAKVTMEKIPEIVENNRRHLVLGEPNLFIIFAEDFDGEDSEVARTVEEYGMILSSSKLRELTSAFSPAFPQYVESTLLHEFGHQIGLPHNERPECIMNSSVESPLGALSFSLPTTPTRFCPFELNQLQEIKKKFQQ